MAIRRVAVLLMDDVAMFELGVLCEVFGTDRSADGFPVFAFDTCTLDGRPVRTRSGFSIQPSADLAPIEHADLVAVPAHPIGTPLPGPIKAAIRRAVDRGAYVISVCSGAFLLAEAGILDGRECTTHWLYTERLQELVPTAKVHPNALYVADGKVVTSAGTASGIDMCLHLLRREHGSAIATKMARRMVVPPQRDGGQAQYVEMPLPKTPEAPTLAPLLQWMMEHLERPITVEDLAQQAHMAPRTFARRFRAETGTTPHDWITGQRVLLARRLLEDTELGIDSVAAKCGFGDGAMLRHHFVRRVGATPQSYRSTFKCDQEAAA